MPNSSARCAQLPRAVDKVPFYAALKKFRDYLKGEIAELDETEVVFTDIKLKSFHEGSSPKFARMNSEFKVLDHNSEDSNDLSIDVRIDPITGEYFIPSELTRSRPVTWGGLLNFINRYCR